MSGGINKNHGANTKHKEMNMENGELKIDKGVPPPPPGSKGARSQYSKALSAMKAGDSIVVDDLRVAKNVYATARYLKVKTTMRAEGNKYRVWRVK